MTLKKTLSQISICLVYLSAISTLKGQDSKVPGFPDKKENLHVFVLMGQSNMSGYGELKPDDRKTQPRVFKIPTRGKRDWVPASHPLHNRLSSDRFGLGLPFAELYLKDKPKVTVGLIPMAWGGSAINGMVKGTKTYKETIEKARLAMKQGTLKGVLWHQGESDTVSKANSEAYDNRLHKLISDLRKDLGNDKLPFIVGNLAEFYGTGKGHNTPDRVARIKNIQRVLRTLPDQVSNTGFVESTGCSSIDKHMVHFDRRSYIVLGQRYAQEFARVTTERQDGTGQPTNSPELKLESKEKPRPESEKLPQ